jgi:NAD(P)-dependent dehydrogenase (short-subunit alcohol dehydrogenase family)
LAFAREGAAGVAVADLNLASAEETLREAETIATNSSFRQIALSLDVTDEPGVSSATEQVVAKFGRVDYCVIAAGIGVETPAATTDVDPQFFKRMMDINVTGSFLVTRSVGNVMKTQSPTPCHQKPERAITRGTIVHLGSSASYLAVAGQCPYAVSKHAVLGLSRNASVDLVGFGVRVNCLCPGWVDTPLVQRAMDKTPYLGEMMNKYVPMGRLAMAEETADAIIYLSSPKSSYVTGCALVIDAGTIVSLKSGV